MGRDESLKLADFLERNAGKYLRAVFHYGDDGIDVEFVRDDVEDDYREADASSIIDAFQAANSEVSDLEELYHVGGMWCMINVFRGALGVHFPHPDGAGTVISLDPQAFEDLYSFMGDCITVIEMGEGAPG